MSKSAAVLDEAPLARFLEPIIRDEMADGRTSKRHALRVAIISAINSGFLQAGARLPPEKELARDLGLSLGTVQAALRQVQDLGMIERRRREGTRVSSFSEFAPTIWHFRMHLLGTDAPFRIHNQDVEVMQTTSRGPWCEHVGDGPNFLMIRRRIEGTDGILVGAEMVLDAALAPPHILSAHELRLTNLRTVLEQKLKVKAAGVVHRVWLANLDVRRLALFAMVAGQPILQVDARTYLTDGRPFYHQTLYVPADKIQIEL
jgi:DNA-binding GntR family transcriptional regulator